MATKPLTAEQIKLAKVFDAIDTLNGALEDLDEVRSEHAQKWLGELVGELEFDHDVIGRNLVQQYKDSLKGIVS